MDEASRKIGNKVSISHIPYELTLCILSKLPLKSLKRFTCVQKSWFLLFQNPLFINMLCNNFMYKHDEDYENTGLLLKEKTLMNGFHDKIFSLFNDKFEDMVRLDWPPTFHDDDCQCINILGSSSVNGIICLYNAYDYYNTTTVLWNPATREFKIIPPSLQQYENIEFNLSPSAFGYDSIRDDYKVIHVVEYPNDFQGNWVYVPEKDSYFWESGDDYYFWDDIHNDVPQVPMYDPFWEIYSLKSNSWKKVDVVDIPFHWPRSTQVNLNEMSHWLGFATQMVSFDFNIEKFVATTLPSHSDPNVIYKELMVLNGSVALMYSYDYMSYFNIWILGELGVEESWTKFFIFGPLTCVNFSIGAGKKSDIYFNIKDGELARFNLRTKKFEEIKLHIDQILIYKEVLLSIPYLMG